MAKALSWKALAQRLGERMRYQAYACEEHFAPDEWKLHIEDCPYCSDTAAFEEYLKKVDAS